MLVAVACLVLGSLLSSLGCDQPQSHGSALQAAETKAGAASVLVWEYGPGHKTADESYSLYAYREKRARQQPYQGVSINVTLLGEHIVTSEDAAAMLRFHDKFKRQKKSEASAIQSSAATLYLKTQGGGELALSHYLGSEAWNLKVAGVPCEVKQDFFDNLSTVMKDLEALKAVPFSVEP